MNLHELNLAKHQYQNDQVVLLPYLKTPGVFPDDLWPRIHARLMDDGTVSTIFPGMGMFSAQDLDRHMKRQPAVLYVIKPDTLVGFGWITQSEGPDGARKAAFGFAFFRSTWGTALVRDLCFLSLAWWFEELKIEILYGSLLKTNRMATNFSRNFGFKDVGDLPMFFVVGGKLVDGHLICLKKSDFMPRYEFHRSTWNEAAVSPAVRSNGKLHLEGKKQWA